MDNYTFLLRLLEQDVCGKRCEMCLIKKKVQDTRIALTKKFVLFVILVSISSVYLSIALFTLL